jgi:CBS domain-containing protein/GNAT superfamily N-acetyltransferase
MTGELPNVLITESRPTDILAALHESASGEREYLFAARDAEPEDLVLVAWEGDAATGMTAIGYIAATDHREDGLAIWEHLVVPSHRTRGLGRRLLGELARRALPGAIVTVDPLGEYDQERISDYYGALGFTHEEADGRIWATVTDLIRATPDGRPAGTERSLPVRTLLERKGSSVVSVDPEATVTEAIDLLNRYRIGALVVSRDGKRVEGILSERDILTGLGHHGAGFLERTVRQATTSDVVTCVAGDTIATAMEAMTRRRVRHLPITETGQLAGIISLGDLVSFRLERVDEPAGS